MNLLLALPILIPLATAIACLFARRSVRIQRVVALAGAAALLVVGVSLLLIVTRTGVHATHFGGWEAPIGVSFVADRFSAALVALTGGVGTLVVIYSWATIDRRRESFGYYPLVHTLLMGVCGSFLTGDIFNLYVWFEVMLMSSFVLLTLGGERGQLEGSIKYVTLNLIASAIFLTAIGLLYGMTGTLNMADLALRVPRIPQQGLVTTVASLFLIAFGIKAGVFPLFFWLPASYHTPPAPITALFAGLLTKVGVYAMMRTFTLIFVGDLGATHSIILGAAGATMIVGVFGAMVQRELRRSLAFLIVSHIGFMMIGLGLMANLQSQQWRDLPESSPVRAVVLLGMTATIFYLFHHIVVKSALFFLAGAIERFEGTGQLDKLGGLALRRSGLAFLFFIAAMALGGVPPLSGFFAKFGLVRAAIESQRYMLAGVTLFVGLLILFTVAKLWAEVFWKSDPRPDEPRPDVSPRSARLMLAPAAILVVLSVALSVFAGPVFRFSQGAAAQLLDPRQYIQAVLGDSTSPKNPKLSQMLPEGVGEAAP